MTRKSGTIGVNGLLGAALGLVALTCASCTWPKVEAAYHEARDLTYVHDEDEDYWQTPVETIARGKGDCEDKAIFLHFLLRERGIDSKVVFGIQNVFRPKVGHAWVECEVDGILQVLDPTGKLLIARADLSTWEYYPVRDSPRIRAKMAEYMARDGGGVVNSDYLLPPEPGGRGAEGKDDVMLRWMLSAAGGAAGTKPGKSPAPDRRDVERE